MSWQQDELLDLVVDVVHKSFGRKSSKSGVGSSIARRFKLISFTV